MKKPLLMIALATFSIIAHSQDFGDIDKAMLLKQPETAKTEIDKLSADPKMAHKPSVLFYKGAVYAAIYAKPDLRAKYSNPEITADSALKQYIMADSAFSMIKQYEFGQQPIFDMYSTSYDMGIRTFTDKKWDSAAHYFGLSEYYINYILTRKWTASKEMFDTASTEYAGFAYQNENQPDMAMKYYTIIAHYKVATKDTRDVYRFMLHYYTDKKDEADFKSILAEAKQLYPDQLDLWNEYEMQYMNNNMNIDDVIAKYKSDDAAGKITTAEQYEKLWRIFCRPYQKPVEQYR